VLSALLLAATLLLATLLRALLTGLRLLAAVLRLVLLLAAVLRLVLLLVKLDGLAALGVLVLILVVGHVDGLLPPRGPGRLPRKEQGPYHRTP